MTVVEEIKSVLALASITSDSDADLTLRERLSEADELVREFAPYAWVHWRTVPGDLVKRLMRVYEVLEETRKATHLSPQARAAMMTASGCVRAAVGIIMFVKADDMENSNSY